MPAQQRFLSVIHLRLECGGRQLGVLIDYVAAIVMLAVERRSVDDTKQAERLQSITSQVSRCFACLRRRFVALRRLLTLPLGGVFLPVSDDGFVTSPDVVGVQGQ